MEIFRACLEDCCWNRRTPCERLLICILIPFLCVVIITLSCAGNFKVVPITCESGMCFKEAAKLKLYINPKTRPCDGLYEHVCAHYKENVDEDAKISIKELQKLQRLEIAREHVNEKEHKMVTTAKILFQKCMNNTEKDELNSIKNALKQAGGWPLLEGTNWNEKQFEWLNSTFRLRALGYDYSAFLELDIVNDPTHDNKFIYKVSPATVHEYDYGIFKLDNLEMIKTVVKMFGVNISTEVSTEIEQMIAFWNELKTKYLIISKDAHEILSVEEYQKHFELFGWLKFINRVAGPDAYIYKQEKALFPRLSNMIEWLNVINNSSKRVQANFMMWRIVAQILPHLTNVSQINARETFEEFCLKDTEQRFIVSPLQVMANRRYLPEEKRKGISDLINIMRDELTHMLSKAKWLQEKQKENAIFIINTMKVLIGQRDDYIPDAILNNLDVDMNVRLSGTFLTLIAQIRKSYVTAIYNQIKVSPSDSFLKQWELDTDHLHYTPEHNTLFIPVAAARRMYFDEKRPNYLNYGIFGSLVSYHLADAIAIFAFYNEKEHFDRIGLCLENQMSNFSIHKDRKSWYPPAGWTIIRHTIGEKLAYAAYNRWIKENKQELPLPGISYTPNQLFWISATSTFCPTNNKGKIMEEFTAMNARISMTNHREVSKDFKCPFGSTMRRINRCRIF